MFYVIINTGQNIRGTKFSPTRPGGEIDEIFLLAKIFSYTVPQLGCLMHEPASERPSNDYHTQHHKH